MKHFPGWIAVFVVISLFLLCPSESYGTSIDRSSICNLEGYPGDVLQEKITLTSSDSVTRNGLWENYYKKVEGDDYRMDISSWLTVEPREFVLLPDVRQVFILKVNIPEKAAAGLWGAKTIDAGLSGHSDERRTYILFKDTQEDGNLYSGMMIPVSVQVLGKASPFSALFSFLNANALVAFLVVVIVALLVIMLTMLKSRKNQGLKKQDSGFQK
jgi:hypothetical protein